MGRGKYSITYSQYCPDIFKICFGCSIIYDIKSYSKYIFFFISSLMFFSHTTSLIETTSVSTHDRSYFVLFELRISFWSLRLALHFPSVCLIDPQNASSIPVPLLCAKGKLLRDTLVLCLSLSSL